jgi:hypothetical protein
VAFHIQENLMTLSKDLVEQFRKVYLGHFGELLDYNKAEQELKELACLVRITSNKEKSL